MYIPSTSKQVKSGNVLDNLSFSNMPTGLYGTGINGAKLTNMMMDTCSDGAKFGTGSQSTGIVADTWTTKECEQAIFLANVSNSTFSNMDLGIKTQSANKAHVLYLERGNHSLTFKNVYLHGANLGQALHLYHEQAGLASDTLTFDGLTIGSPTQPQRCVIITGYKTVIFKNIKCYAKSGDPVFNIYGADDILVDGFECWGGDAMVGCDSDHVKPTNVRLANGVYHGTKWYAGFTPTMTNVSLNGVIEPPVPPPTPPTPPIPPQPSTRLQLLEVLAAETKRPWKPAAGAVAYHVDKKWLDRVIFASNKL